MTVTLAAWCIPLAVTLALFAWALLTPERGSFDFAPVLPLRRSRRRLSRRLARLGPRPMTPEIAAVIEAARALVEGRRRFLGLPADTVLPGSWEAHLEKAVAAMTAAEPTEDRP